MSDFEKLNIVLAARDREFAKAMESNTRRVERFANRSQKNLSKTGKKFDVLGKSAKALGPLLAALGAGAVIGKLRATISTLDDIGKTADRIGITTDALQELRAVGESAGVAQSALDTSLEKLSKNLGEAAMGTGLARVALDQLGLSATKLQGLGLDGAVSAIATAMQGVEDPTTRTALAMQLFGKSGAGMLNLLREGADGIEKMRKEAREMGVVIDESLIRGAEEAQTKLDLLSRVISAQLSSALINLAPLLVGAAEGIVSITNAVRDFLSMDFALPELMGADQLHAAAAGIAGLESELDGVAQAQAAYNANLDKFGETSSQAMAWADRLAAAQERLASATAARDAKAAASQRAVAGIKDIAAETKAAEDKARLQAMSAEAAERERISTAATAKYWALRNDVAASRGGDLAEGELAKITQIVDAWEAAETAASRVLNPAAKTGGAGGAGGKAAAGAEDYTRALERLGRTILETGAGAASLDAELANVQARFDAGEISAADYADALDQIDQRYGELENTAQSMESATEDMFASIITGSKSAGDALADLLSQWAGMAAKSAFSGLFGGLFDGVAGIFSSQASLGAAPGKTLGAPGLSGQVKALARLPVSGALPSAQAGPGAATAAAPGALQLNINVTGARGNSEITDMVRAGVRQGIEHFDRVILPSRVGQISSDPRRVT